MFPEESSGAKDCNPKIGVGLASTRTTLIESAFGDSRHEQVRLVISGSSGSAIGRCKGPTRRTGRDRSSLCETSGGSGSSQHDDYCGYSNSQFFSPNKVAAFECQRALLTFYDLDSNQEVEAETLQWALSFIDVVGVSSQVRRYKRSTCSLQSRSS